jgi:hypothetical protein
MKHLKTFETYNSDKYEFNKHPLNEQLLELFDKYNTYDYNNNDKPKWVGDKDVLESLEMIQGDGELITDSHRAPRYIEHFGDLALVVFGYASGLIGKYQYVYEIKVVKKSTKQTTQVGGGYGTSGIDFSSYDTPAHIVSDNCPPIDDKEVISKVINEFRELLK